MAFLLRSHKYLRNFLEISQSFVLDAAPGYVPRCVGVQCSPFISSKWIHTVSKPVSIKESLLNIEERMKKYRRINRQDVDALFKTVADNGNIDSVQALAALKCFGEVLTEEPPEVRIRLVQNMWNAVKSANIPIEIDHYNALMTAYVENEFPFTPDDFFRQLQARGFYPNRMTFQILMKKYSVEGDIGNIKTLLGMLEARQMSLNLHIYNSLILAYGNAGDFETANAYLEQLKSSDLKPNTITYRHLVLPHARSGAIEKIISELNRFREENIILSDRDILSIIYELSIKGHGDHVHEVLPFLTYTTGYNGEAHRCVIKLVNKNQDDTAFTILKTMIPAPAPSTGKALDRGRFYLKQLLKLGRPMQYIFAECDKLKDNGLCEEPITALLYAASYLESSDVGTQILHELKSKGIPVTADNFQPMFRSLSNAEEVQRILKLMKDEYDVAPDLYLLREYIIPAFGPDSPENIVLYLQAANISKRTAVTAVALCLLRDAKIKEASDLIEYHKIGIYFSLFERDLLSSLIARNDGESFVKFVRIAYQNSHGLQKFDNALPLIDELGEFVVNTINSLQRISRPEVITMVVDNLIKEKVRIPVTYVNAITEAVDPVMVPRLTDLIATADDMLPKKPHADPRFLLLASHYEAKNTAEYTKCFEQLEQENVKMTRLCYVQMVILQVVNNDIPMALKSFYKYREIYPDLKLNKSRTITNIIQHLYENNRLNEALDFLDINSQSEINERGNDAALLIYGKFLYAVAETGNVDDVEILFDRLMDQKYFKFGRANSNLNVLGPLVKVHLAKGNSKTAVAIFERLALEHKVAPLRSELTLHLIRNDDQENIKRVTDAVAKIYGKNASQFSLAIAYIESGKLEEAAEIFTSKLSTIHPKRLEEICNKFADRDQVGFIETLLQLTRDVNYYDKTIVWNKLLDVYCKDRSTERVIQLMNQIREERCLVDYNFVCKLQDFFKELGEKMPFLLRIKNPNKPALTAQPSETPKKLSTDKNLMPLFSKFIDTNDIVNFGIVDIGQLKSYLGNLIITGNVEKFEAMKKKIPEGIRYECKFDTFVVATYLKSERIGELIDQTVESLKDAVDEAEINALGREIPSANYFEILKANREVLPKLRDLAIEFSKNGRFGPMSALWCYHILENNDIASRELWDNFLIAADRVDFGALIGPIKGAKDARLARTLVDFLKTSQKTSKSAVGVAYNLLIMKLSRSKEYDEGLNVVEESIQNECFEFVQPMTLEQLRDGLQKMGKTFPYSIPTKSNETKGRKYNG